MNLETLALRLSCTGSKIAAVTVTELRYLLIENYQSNNALALIFERPWPTPHAVREVDLLLTIALETKMQRDSQKSNKIK